MVRCIGILVASQRHLAPITAFLILQLLLQSSAVNGTTLKLVQVVWRNGDRNPSEVCPNDPHDEASFHQGFGYLTVDGMQEHFQLGKKLFEEYTKSDFMRKYYDPREIYIRSADTNRTILSANSNMLGMYSSGTQKESIDFPQLEGWPKNVVPVSVHSDAAAIDYESEMAPCPRRDNLYLMLKDTQEYKKLNDDYKTLLSDISLKCGKEIDLFNLDIVRRTYTAEKDFIGGPFFNESEYNLVEAVEEKVEELKGGKGSIIYNGTKLSEELLQLRFGSLIKRIIDHCSLKIHCNTMLNQSECEWMKMLKYYAYSLHSTTVNGIMNLLIRNLTEVQPQLSRKTIFALALELHEITDQNYGIKVKIFSQNGTQDVTKFISDCNEYCDFNNFKTQMSKLIPQNIKDDCTANVPPPSTAQTPVKTKALPTTITPVPLPAADELVFIQAFWRHGDRSPLSGCEKDPNPDSVWHIGSGQLSPIGMKQHFRKGRMIYDRYVTEKKFLSDTYKAKEIYAHSTGFNRTIISAMSNLIGMYSSRGALIKGLDYPNISGWPSDYVPIPVHNYDNKHDHMGDPNTPCPRQEYFVDLAENAAEVLNYEKEMKSVLDKASELCGHQLTLFSITRPLDANLIEGLYNHTQLFDSELHAQLQEMEGVAENVKHGLLAYNYIQNGHNLRIEIPRTRGGSALWNAINHMQLKINCIENRSAEYCQWINDLKYFIFSGHDSTVDAVLTTLGMKERVVPGGIPDYTATIMFELYRTPNNQYRIKVMYHRNVDALQWEDVTGYITGCPDNGNCLFPTFVNRSKPFYPEDINQLCQQIPESLSTTSTSSVSTTSAAISFNQIFNLLNQTGIMLAALLVKLIFTL